MKTKILATVLALACLSASAAIIERTCVVSNQTYLVKYEYNKHGPFEVPATASGQAHYSCKVTVFLQQYNVQLWMEIRQDIQVK